MLVSSQENETTMKKTALTRLNIALGIGKGLNAHFERISLLFTDFQYVPDIEPINSVTIQPGDIYTYIKMPSGSSNFYSVNTYVNNSNSPISQQLTVGSYYTLNHVYTIDNDSIIFYGTIYDSENVNQLLYGSDKISANDIESQSISVNTKYYTFIFDPNDIPSDIEIESMQLVKNITITQNHDNVNPLIIEPDEGYEAMESVAAVVQVPQPNIENSLHYVCRINDNDNLWNLTQSNYNKHFTINPSSGYDAIGTIDNNVKLYYREITSNGTYTALDFRGTDTSALGFYKVLVNVPTPSPNLENNYSQSIASNGTYSITPSSGYDGISSGTINVNVPTSAISVTKIRYYYGTSTNDAAPSSYTDLNISDMSRYTSSSNYQLASGKSVIYIYDYDSNVYKLGFINNNSGSTISVSIGSLSRYIELTANFVGTIQLYNSSSSRINILNAWAPSSSITPKACLGYNVNCNLWKSFYSFVI